MADFDHINLSKVIVGGEPVGFTRSTGILQLAGGDFTLKEWQELERRINLFFTRAGLLQDEKQRSDPNSGSSSFLTHNLRQILDREEGIIKNPPMWLRGLYSGVITKERLWEM